MENKKSIICFAILNNKSQKMIFNQNDSNTCKIEFKIYNTSILDPILDITFAVINIQPPSGSPISYGMECITIEGNVVTFTLPTTALNIQGNFTGELFIYGTNYQRLTICKIRYSVIGEIVFDKPIQDDEHYPVLTALINTTQSLVDAQTNNEADMVESESTRKNNETSRISAEILRESTTNTIKSAYDTATKANLSVEVSNARGTFGTLSDRLNNNDSSLAEKAPYHISNDRFFAYNKTTGDTNKWNPLIIDGDSISEGSDSDDFVNSSWAGILIKAMNRENGNRNYGFSSFRDLSIYPTLKTFHTILNNGFNISFNDNYFGGILATSSTVGQSIQATYTGKDVQLVYGQRSDGGIVNVLIDNIQRLVIDTSQVSSRGYSANASLAIPVVVTTWGVHTVKFVKADNKPTDLCGLIYKEDSSTPSPIVYNVSRSSIALANISNEIINDYNYTGMQILALGVNDQLLNTDINTFKAKLSSICTSVTSVNGSLIICDFMFSLPDSNPYKVAIKNVALQFPQFDYLDFAKLWFQDMNSNKYSNYLNVDGVHPTNQGHEFIANTILKRMGLPYTKAILNKLDSIDNLNNIVSQTFSPNINWDTALTTGYDNVLRAIKQGNDIYIKGILHKSIAVVQYESVANIPAGYRPSKSRILGATASHGFAEIEIDPNGDILYLVGDCSSYLSIDVHYRLDY